MTGSTYTGGYGNDVPDAAAVAAAAAAAAAAAIVASWFVVGCVEFGWSSPDSGCGTGIAGKSWALGSCCVGGDIGIEVDGGGGIGVDCPCC